MDTAKSPCGCDEMSICSSCTYTRAVPCPGLPNRRKCNRLYIAPGEIKLYGHCILCESMAEAERRFRQAEAGRRTNENLNELPMPGYVRQIDAARLLTIIDDLSGMIALPLEVPMSETKPSLLKGPCLETDEDCDHSPKFEPHPPLEDGNTAEPKHTEAAPLVPIIPLGS